MYRVFLKLEVKCTVHSEELRRAGAFTLSHLHCSGSLVKFLHGDRARPTNQMITVQAR